MLGVNTKEELLQNVKDLLRVADDFAPVYICPKCVRYTKEGYICMHCGYDSSNF